MYFFIYETSYGGHSEPLVVEPSLSQDSLILRTFGDGHTENHIKTMTSFRQLELTCFKCFNWQTHIFVCFPMFDWKTIGRIQPQHHTCLRALQTVGWFWNVSASWKGCVPTLSGSSHFQHRCDTPAICFVPYFSAPRVTDENHVAYQSTTSTIHFSAPLNAVGALKSPDLGLGFRIISAIVDTWRFFWLGNCFRSIWSMAGGNKHLELTGEFSLAMFDSLLENLTRISGWLLIPKSHGFRDHFPFIRTLMISVERRHISTIGIDSIPTNKTHMFKIVYTVSKLTQKNRKHMQTTDSRNRKPKCK